MKIGKCLDFVLDNIEAKVKFTEATSSAKEKIVLCDLHDIDVLELTGELYENKEAVILAVQYYFFLLENANCDVIRHDDFVTFMVTW